MKLRAAFARHGFYRFQSVCVFTILSALFALSSVAATAQCVSTGAQWKSVAMGAAQHGTFTTTFDATPSAAKMNAVIGVSHGAATGYDSLAANVRFNSSGFIDVRNASGYAASAPVAYSAGVTYHFELDINLSTHHYSAFVTPPGGKRITLATNFAFRSTQSTVSSLDTWDLFAAAGSVTGCSFKLTCPPLFAPPAPKATLGGPFSNPVTLSDPVPVPSPIPGCPVPTMNFYDNGTLIANVLLTSPTTTTNGFIGGNNFTAALTTPGIVGPQSPPTIVFIGDATPTPTPLPVNWNQFGFASSGGRYNPGEFFLNTGTVGSLSVAWTFPMNGLVGSSPTEANGIVYSGAGGSGNDFNLYALNATTGAKIWSFATGGIVGSAPALANGAVYFSSTDNNVYAANATTGAELWSVPISAGSPIAFGNGAIYFGAFGILDHKVYALNPATGAVLWSFTPGDIVQSTPAIANGVVYFGSRDRSVYALDANSGAKLWSFATLGEISYSSPAVVNGVVYIASTDGSVYALDATTGAKLWSFATSGLIGASPAVANGVVYIGSTDMNFYALNATSGAKLWSFTTGNGNCCFSSAAAANGVVYFGATDNNVYALDAQTGTRLFTFTTGREILSSPIVVNGWVYIGSDDSKLYAFHR